MGKVVRLVVVFCGFWIGAMSRESPHLCTNRDNQMVMAVMVVVIIVVVVMVVVMVMEVLWNS